MKTKKLMPVIIIIRDGAVAGWTVPAGVRVEVRDYDVVDCAGECGDKTLTDKTGDHFHRTRLGYWRKP